MEDFSGGPFVKNMPANAGLEKEMATQSSIHAWRIPRTEVPGGMWSIGLQRVECGCMDVRVGL